MEELAQSLAKTMTGARKLYTYLESRSVIIMLNDRTPNDQKH
jgi:hypothetical protein